MQQLHTMHNERTAKRKQKATERRAANLKKRERDGAAVEAASKQLRKKRYVKQGMDDKRKAKAAARENSHGD
jgi:hypothetical protein